jgi:hypothetical protein
MDISKNWSELMRKCLLVTLFIFSGFIYLIKAQIDVPRIKYIALNSNENVEIAWEKSTSADVSYYTIWYLGYTGNNPIPSLINIDDNIKIPATDSVYSFPFAFVEGVDLKTTPVEFAVKAHNSSGVPSDAYGLDWDSSMVLKAEFDSCLSEIRLSWNRYDFNNWGDGLKAYRIYMSVNGGPSTIYRTVYVESYTITDFLPDNDYYLYIAAIPNPPLLPSDSSTTYPIQINTHMANIPEYIYADYATNSGGNTDLQFTVDPAGELKKYSLLRSKSPIDNFEEISNFNTDNHIITYTDNVDYLSGPYYYKLAAINNCNLPAVYSKNTASSIVLQVAGEPLAPQLSWNKYTWWINGIDNYTLERKFGNEPYEQIDQANPNDSSYVDNDISGLATTDKDASVCYRVTATEQGNLLGNNATSTSNEVCIDLPFNIRFEYDAFIPGSDDNNRFGPTIDYLPDEFHFEILDRSERVVYTSDDSTICHWDGRINGSLAPAGAYMYVLKFRNKGGKYKILRGGLAVVYP